MPVRTVIEPFGPGSEKTSLFATLCAKRGWTPDAIEAIDDPAHDELRDTHLIVEQLHSIRTNRQKIVVLPDFDMDGITSGVIGLAGLAELGFDVELYVPDYRRGHDISPDAVQELFHRHPGVEAVITCDGGVNSHAGIQRGKDLGLTMLVTDHHVQEDQLSPADVVIDPERLDETYAHPGICGAHVLYQVLMSYAARYRPDKVAAISHLRLFAGIGTVSDVMPLLYENRQLVRDSSSLARLLYVNIPAADLATEYNIEHSTLMYLLRSQNHHPAYVSVFEGFALMLKAFREAGKLRSIRDLNEEFYGFYLSPAFNSIRRADGDMRDAFGVFTADTPEQKMVHAVAVIELNEKRKALTEEYMLTLEEEELQGMQPLAPWVYITDAPTGMLGLMANKLMHANGIPTAVVCRPANSRQSVGGSARSPFWFPIISTMTPHGFRAVGHENACGVGAQNWQDMIRFAEVMKAEAEAIMAAAIADGSMQEASKADMELGFGPSYEGSISDPDALLDFASQIETMRPFGQGFPKPTFDILVNLNNCSVTTLGKDESHIKIVLPNGVSLPWWNAVEPHWARMQDILEDISPRAGLVKIRVTLGINVFMGNESVQGIVESVEQRYGRKDNH